jgi:hypothetical protein
MLLFRGNSALHSPARRGVKSAATPESVEFDLGNRPIGPEPECSPLMAYNRLSMCLLDYAIDCRYIRYGMNRFVLGVVVGLVIAQLVAGSRILVIEGRKQLNP